MDIDKGEVLLTLLRNLTVRVAVVNILFVTLRTTLLPTARGGFLVIKYVFSKDMCGNFPHNSLQNFTNDFKKCFHDYHLLSKKGKKGDNQPPSQYSVATLFYHTLTQLCPVNLRQNSRSDRHPKLLVITSGKKINNYN